MVKTTWLYRFFKRLYSGPARDDAERPEVRSEVEMAKQMVRGIVTTREDELGCDECFEQVDRFAEMVLANEDAAVAMPLIEDHLNRCKGCREEFEALLDALRAVSAQS
jgi:hypothetical protein